MSRRTAEASKAVLAAWEKEKELVKNGKGTRDWTPEQQKDILTKGKAYDENGFAFEGQHMRSVEKYPEYQGEPANIQFLTRSEHLEAHDGNWQNPTNWYFDPVTKEKLHFGEGPIIPCKIIQLTRIGNRYDSNPEIIRHHDKEYKSSTTQQNKTKKVAGDRVKKNSFWKLKVKPIFKNIYNTTIDFCRDNPEVVVEIIGAFLLAGGKTLLKNGKSSDSNIHDTSSQYYTEDEFGDIENYTESESVGRLQGPHNSPEEHIVKAHGQRYHYKDGSVRWKEKHTYSRGKSNDK